MTEDDVFHILNYLMTSTVLILFIFIYIIKKSMKQAIE
jgi:hypothetical protein